MTGASETFVEKIALHVQGRGMPRSTGRILGLLLLRDGSVSLDEFTEELRISKASASTGARYLERLGMIERVPQPGTRRDFYRLVDEPARGLVLHVDALREMATILQDGSRTVTGLPAEVRMRLNRMAQMHREATDFLERLLRRKFR